MTKSAIHCVMLHDTRIIPLLEEELKPHRLPFASEMKIITFTLKTDVSTISVIKNTISFSSAIKVTSSCVIDVMYKTMDQQSISSLIPRPYREIGKGPRHTSFRVLYLVTITSPPTHTHTHIHAQHALQQIWNLHLASYLSSSGVNCVGHRINSDPRAV